MMFDVDKAWRRWRFKTAQAIGHQKHLRFHQKIHIKRSESVLLMRETSGCWCWYPWLHSAWLDAHCDIATGSIVSSIYHIIYQLSAAPFNSIVTKVKRLLEMFPENDFTLKSEDSNLSKIWLCNYPADPSLFFRRFEVATGEHSLADDDTPPASFEGMDRSWSQWLLPRGSGALTRKSRANIHIHITSDHWVYPLYHQ